MSLVRPNGPPSDHPLAALIEHGPDWRESAGHTVPYIVPGLIVAGGFCVVAGEPKTGKSWLAYAAALGIANGQPALGEFQVEQPGRVLYIANEGSKPGSKARIDALARGMGLDPINALGNIDFIWRRQANLDDSAFLRALTAAAPLYRLIVVDVLKKAWNGDENSNREVGRLLRGIENVTRRGPTLMVVHHFAKASEATSARRHGQRIVGATAIHAAVDSGLYLERTKDDSRTRVTVEQKDTAPAEPFTIAWPTSTVSGREPITLDYRPERQETESEITGRLVVDQLRLGALASKNAIHEALRASGNGRDKGKVLRAIDYLLQKGLIRKAPEGFVLAADGTGAIGLAGLAPVLDHPAEGGLDDPQGLRSSPEVKTTPQPVATPAI